MKSRLSRGIGVWRAAALYEAFLKDLATELVSAEWESVLATDGSETNRLERIFPSGWSLRAQGGGSLGDRLARAAAAAFGEGVAKVALAGSDAPTLSAVDVGTAFAALDGADVAVAPAPDGGFSLVALRPPASPSRLFGSVRWSTRSAFSDLRQNTATARLGMRLLPEIPDVDVAGDLAAIRRRLAADAWLAPATRAILKTL